ncbi:MAG TPA: family 1 glycosylhydrolase [Acidimicrobiales bacterium]|nr:family 1 glycosylhydrolase [Acidimicrobiales bacterium]
MSGPIRFIGAFESTYQPAHDRDVVETTEHDVRWRDDLRLLASCHVKQLRYPLRWHRIEPEPGQFDWSHTDEVLGYMQDNGFEPIVDLLHHTSYPLWLGDFTSPEFGSAFLRFCEAVAHRYPWLPAYTVCNEPFTTFLLCGQEGVWAPHHRGLRGLIRLAQNVFPAVTEATRLLKGLLPEAEHVHVEATERHTWTGAAGESFAQMTNDRRFFFTDLLVGRPIDTDRPFVRDLLQAGGEGLLDIDAGHIDVLGLDYYAHNQWHWTGPNGKGTNMPPDPASLADLIVEYWDRYQLPIILGETNIRGFASDRASWLKYTLEQCEAAAGRGVDMRGYCWFPFIDSADWGSLLQECEGAIDPVGVFWLDDDKDRRPSSMSASYRLAARGMPAAELPAYRFRPPVSNWLQGWMPQMSHWQWRLPPQAEACSNAQDADARIELRIHNVA